LIQLQDGFFATLNKTLETNGNDFRNIINRFDGEYSSLIFYLKILVIESFLDQLLSNFLISDLQTTYSKPTLGA